MNPTELIGPSSPLGFPAPFWFIEFFKVFGFILHMVPMNIWFAGMILIMLMQIFGSENGKKWSARIANQMPVIVASGVNFGIVPLLFTQVAYYRVFYPATILMAWPWFAVIVFVTLAYYGVYIYVIGLRNNTMTAVKRLAGWISAVFFIITGFIFSNAFSLMVNIGAWEGLWKKTSLGGALLGTALNIADPTLFPRWLLMFGLAVMTTAAYTVFDAAYFAGRESEAYKKWVPIFAFKLYTFGMVWFAAMGSWYVFGTWSEELRAKMFTAPLLFHTVTTAICPGLAWLLILAQRKGVARSIAAFTGIAQVGVLAINAVSRQIVQNTELKKYIDVSAEQVNMQWSPMITFLVLFVEGLGVVVWMVSKVVAAERKITAQSSGL